MGDAGRAGKANSPLRRWALALAILPGLLSAAFSAQAATPLPAKYKKWLEQEVVYIISDQEKEVFLNLTSEVARDKFIEEFWRIRDPNPETPINEYKEEHYRRIEHANRYFGRDTGMEGWRTDRGRTYIQLGEPQQRIHHRWLGEIRPVDLWFYSQNINPSLPNAFYVMFFRPDAGSAYRLYSPYIDGPDKLVTKIGHENDPLSSYRFLQRFDREIARASVTLLTDEPIDPTTFTPSLASDALLTRIRNLPNDKFTRELLERRRELGELVRTRIIYEPSELEVLAVPFEDAGGQSYLHFLLLLPDPLKEVASRDKEKYVSLTVNVLVHDSEKKSIFQQNHKNRYTAQEDFARQQEWRVSYEDLLPLAPGEYEIDFVVRNEFTNTLYRGHHRVQVPGHPNQGLQISPLVVYDEVYSVNDQPMPFPFRVASFKFAPRMERRFGTNEELGVFFQMVNPSAGPDGSAGEVLRVDYALGNPAGGYRETLSEEISKRDFTRSGTVLHGKSFPLSRFPTGSYRLVVTVTDPATKERASQTLTFRVVPGSVESWLLRLVNTKIEADFQAGLLDYRRALCELARNHAEPALRSLQEALARNPGLHQARNRLVELYFAKGELQQVASLFPSDGLTGDTDLETIGRYITSFERLGRLDNAIEIGQRALELWGPQAFLYENLARLFEHTGQLARAQEMRSHLEQFTSPRK